MPACVVVFLLSTIFTINDLWAKATVLRRQFLRETEAGRLLTLRGNTPFPNEFVANPDYHEHGWLPQVELGIILWGMRVYPLPNLQTAFEHQQRILPLNQGVYLINERYPLKVIGPPKPVDLIALATLPGTRLALYEGGEWHDGMESDEMDLDKWRYLSVAEFRQYLPDDNKRFPVVESPRSSSSGGIDYYGFQSFALPKVVGINHSETLREFRSLFNYANRRLADGYQFRFNDPEIEKIIDKLKNQSRRGQRLTMSRYRNEEVADKLRKAFAGGKAFTVSLRNRQDELVAGVVGYVHNNRFSPDSVFYDDVKDAKIADFALMRYLTAQGINFVDAGMVTGYTAEIGGYRVSRQQFAQLVAELPDREVVLPQGWQGTISLVVATKKTSQNYLQHLVDNGTVTGPLLLIKTTSSARPHLQKDDRRHDALLEVLAEVEGLVILEGNRQPIVFDRLPESLIPYLQEILAIEIDVVGKASIIKVTTLSGFPIPLLK